MSAGSETVGTQALTDMGEATGHPNIARVYDFLLGGKDSFAADRLFAARIVQTQPLVVAGARSNRAFLRRAVAFLAEQGIDQFLDIGSGLPTGNNLHEVARRVNPRARTVYVDSDSVVLVHARALLADNRRTIVIEGDLRKPREILSHPDLCAHVDLARPLAVVMCAIFHFVGDHEDPAGIVHTFRDALAPGSAVAISHVVDDGDDAASEATRRAARIYSETTTPFFSELRPPVSRWGPKREAPRRRPVGRRKALPPFAKAGYGTSRSQPDTGGLRLFSQQVVVRSRDEVAAWFDGFSLVPPGLVDADLWRRTSTRKTTAPIVAGVGLLPDNPSATRK